MTLTLPYPPSANSYWRTWKGRILVSAEARAYKANVKFRAMLDNTLPKALAGPVVVTAWLFRPAKRGDLDNSLKVLLDAIRGIAFEDDGQIVELHAARFEDKANPRAVVTVEAA